MQAEIVDPEHEEINKTVVRAQAEEAVIAAKLAEAERNFAEKAERLVSKYMTLATISIRHQWIIFNV